MTEIIISEMSQITISDDLLKQVDMHDLLEKFRNNHDRLDDFKNTRDKHEKRKIGKKIWDFMTFDKTIENAQLNATEIQAEFSKALGQLMVISVAQAQHLQHQQEQLAMQQGIIKNQTEKIEVQTHELDQQHEVLAKQNTDLEKLVNDYFELRGLTQDGAKKLISIANDIQHTRDELLESMESTRNWITEQQEKTVTNISLQIASFDESTQKNVADIIKRCEQISTDSNHLSQQILEIKTAFLKKYEDFDIVLINERDRLNTHETNTEKNLTDLANSLNVIQEEFRIFREKQQKKIEKLTIIFSTISIGLMSTVMYLLLT